MKVKISNLQAVQDQKAVRYLFDATLESGITISKCKFIQGQNGFFCCVPSIGIKNSLGTWDNFPSIVWPTPASKKAFEEACLSEVTSLVQSLPTKEVFSQNTQPTFPGLKNSAFGKKEDDGDDLLPF